MDTSDLSSYYPGYDDYCDDKATVPFEDYRNLEEKLGIYESAIDEINSIFNEPDNKSSKDLQCIKAIIYEMKERL